jgi:hypothetical protein
MAQQFKKLLYNKHFTDSGGLAKWKLAPWKVFGIFLLLSIASILLYAFFFTKDPRATLGNVLFYAIILIIAILAIYLVGNKAWSVKNRIAYFLITFIVLWVVYFVMYLVFGYVGIKFYIGGYALWTIIAILAGLGGSKYLFDNEINRKDFIFAGLVFIVFLGANLPMNSTGGFLANLDKLLTTIFKFFKI